MDSFHPGVLFVLGLGVFGGIMGAWLFQKMRIPQVVGYIAIGLLIGETGLRIITAEQVASMRLLTQFAVGIIGLLVGGELQGSTFRQYGKQFSAILLGEGIGAFILVGAASGLVVYAATHSVSMALAAGIVLGAISSATDPASTIDVLWEYRARGALTTAIIAVVALDDALAMTLYGFGTTVAGMLTGGEHSFLQAARQIGVELCGAVALGLVAGLVLNFVLRHLRQPERSLALAIGMILLVIAVAAAYDMDVILATMSMGVMLVNIAPLRSKELFAVVRNFASPIYVIFFVFIGARLTIHHLPPWIWLIVGLYVLLRTAGKMLGTMLGAALTHAPSSVRKYGGMGLFAQGGVAVGLSIVASQRLGHISVSEGLGLGDMIIYVVTATTLIVQIIGPPMVKLAVKLAGEIGRNVTEEDVARTLTVRAAAAEVALVPANEPVKAILARFAGGDSLVFPVVGADGALAGVLTLDGMKAVLASHETWRWLVADDVMQPARTVIVKSMPLTEALALLDQVGQEQLPIVNDLEQRRPVGLLDRRRARAFVKEETLRRQAPPEEAAEPV